jgi:hypothetical protein
MCPLFIAIVFYNVKTYNINYKNIKPNIFLKCIYKDLLDSVPHVLQWEFIL